METAAYIALSRQTALFRQMDVIANNVANINTAGYKSEYMLFQELVSGSGAGQSSFASDVATIRKFDQGDLKFTGRPLDVALDGDGFFTVQTDLGPRYTRVGQLNMGRDGQLQGTSGHSILDAGGVPITLSPNDTDISIGEDGTITATENGARVQRGQIGVVRFNDLYQLQKTASGLFESTEAPFAAIPHEDYVLSQGMIEGSNVNPTLQVTEMIEVSRSVGRTSKMMNELHELQRQAVSTIAKQGQ